MARSALTGGAGWGTERGWRLAFDGFWCTVRPPGSPAGPPAAGRPLHVGAAGTVAAEVLAEVAGVLAEDPCPFRFAADRERLRQLDSGAGEDGSDGFITVHPLDEAQARRLAGELHRATEGLPGPTRPPTGRPYAPGSRVHLGYAAPRAEPGTGGERTAAGRVRVRPAGPVEGRGSAGPLPVADRYVLTTAVRRGGRGDLFLGRDLRTGAEVLIRQARAGGPDGLDARTALRHEACLLAELAAHGLTPRPLALIERTDSLLLVQERVPGRPLAGWVSARLAGDGAPGVPWEAAGPMALALVDLVERVHAAGLVLRDLAPANVLVRPDGSLRLLDLELACVPGTVAPPAGTPGYRAPERPAGRATVNGVVPYGGCRAEPTADLYALGGLLFLLATGHDPVLPAERPPLRPETERLARWLELAAREGRTARRLARAVLALRAEQPERRWTPARVRAELARAAATSDPSPRAVALPRRGPAVAGPSPERVLHESLRHLAETATPQRPDRLWPEPPGGQRTDPTAGRHEAAGALAVLARAAVAPGLPPELRAAVGRTARTAAGWLERRCATEPLLLPGRHFGRSGPLWALLDAADALADRELAARTRRLATRLPPVRPRPGSQPAEPWHCAAGTGFLRLRLGESVATTRSGDFRLGPDTAGRGALLLAAHRATGDPAPLAAAAEAARSLATGWAAAGPEAWWSPGTGEPDERRLAHWCAGPAGVGGFLVRLWRATGDPAVRAVALSVGQAVLDGLDEPDPPGPYPGSTLCHGPAGDGEYLLDLAEATGEQRFKAGAERLGRLLASRATSHEDGLPLPPGEPGGGADTLGFLLRLCHGGPRLWLDLPSTPAPGGAPGTPGRAPGRTPGATA
ncbi:lanthionine synthetase LanC family protein [Kitasatospora sp. NPDC052896]|uniref:class III lanthionine synthetase LanKC N-terminal domain-containing protein n=1 Tax=Kitasatospora sp. NPDC052896 TaxID=3364061 RepID=UPI0037C6B425